MMDPTKAPAMMAVKPVRVVDWVSPRLPPKRSMTSATPRLAPVSMPSIEGPASGLLKAVCSSRPATASAAPESRAATICGRRDSSTMKRHTSFSLSRPQRISHTAEAGICTDPNHRLVAHRATSSTMSSPMRRLAREVWRGLFIRLRVGSNEVDSGGSDRGGRGPPAPARAGRGGRESLRSSCIRPCCTRRYYDCGRP